MKEKILSDIGLCKRFKSLVLKPTFFLKKLEIVRTPDNSTEKPPKLPGGKKKTQTQTRSQWCLEASTDCLKKILNKEVHVLIHQLIHVLSIC